MYEGLRNNAEPEQFQGKDIATQAHNNQSQLLNPRCLVEYPPQLETSFQKDMGEAHCQDIWNASSEYLKKTLLESFPESKGFNNEHLFSGLSSNEESQNSIEPIYNLLARNNLFSKQSQRSQLLVDLKAQPNLMKLLNHLSSKFQQEIFNELCFIIFEAWEAYLRQKKKYTLPQVLRLPMFNGIREFSDIRNENKNNQYMPFTDAEVEILAKEVGEEIAALHFLNPKIKFLTLRECQKAKKQERFIRSQFSTFMEAIVKAVFSCLEGQFECQEPGLADNPRNSFQSEIPESEIEDSYTIRQLQPRKRRDLSEE